MLQISFFGNSLWNIFRSGRTWSEHATFPDEQIKWKRTKVIDRVCVCVCREKRCRKKKEWHSIKYGISHRFRPTIIGNLLPSSAHTKLEGFEKKIKMSLVIWSGQQKSENTCAEGFSGEMSKVDFCKVFQFKCFGFFFVIFEKWKIAL